MTPASYGLTHSRLQLTGIFTSPPTSCTAKLASIKAWTYAASLTLCFASISTRSLFCCGGNDRRCDRIYKMVIEDLHYYVAFSSSILLPTTSISKYMVGRTRPSIASSIFIAKHTYHISMNLIIHL